jgi:hypothetical protein
MKKLIVALLIIAFAAPAAWGLYSTREPTPHVAPPPATGREALPVLRPLEVFNDWAISLKRRIKAYIYSDRRVAREGWAKKCLTRIGAGLYVSARRMRGEDITAVAGKIYNVSGSARAPAAYTLQLYDKAGVMIGGREVRISEIPAHGVLGFRTVVQVPGRDVVTVRLLSDNPVTGH